MHNEPPTGTEGLVRILLLEDNSADAFLVERALKESGFIPEIQRAATQDEFMKALKARNADVIIADNALPGFSGATALAISRERAPETPFLVLTGNADQTLA